MFLWVVVITYEYQTARRHISQDGNHIISLPEKLKSDDVKRYYNKLLQMHLSL